MVTTLGEGSSFAFCCFCAFWSTKTTPEAISFFASVLVHCSATLRNLSNRISPKLIAPFFGIVNYLTIPAPALTATSCPAILIAISAGVSAFMLIKPIGEIIRSSCASSKPSFARFERTFCTLCRLPTTPIYYAEGFNFWPFISSWKRVPLCFPNC